MINIPKFKTDQKVRCIINVNPRHNQESGHPGAGWIIVQVFIITRITETSGDDIPIYWGNEVDGGVYEDFIELVKTEWDTEENNV